MDNKTLNSLIQIADILKQCEKELSEYEYKKIVIWRERLALLTSLIISMYSQTWWVFIMIVIIIYMLITSEIRLRYLKSRKRDNQINKENKHSDLVKIYNFNYDFENFFIKTMDCTKRLNLSSGNWVDYYK